MKGGDALSMSKNDKRESLSEEAFLQLTDDERQAYINNRFQPFGDEQLYEQGFQRCTRCQNVKHLDADNFAPAPTYRHKFRRRCRVCDNDVAKAWQKENQVRATKNRREWVANNREDNRTYQRDRYNEMSAALRYIRENHIPLDTSTNGDNHDGTEK